MSLMMLVNIIIAKSYANDNLANVNVQSIVPYSI